MGKKMISLEISDELREALRVEANFEWDGKIEVR